MAQQQDFCLKFVRLFRMLQTIVGLLRNPIQFETEAYWAGIMTYYQTKRHWQLVFHLTGCEWHPVREKINSVAGSQQEP